VHTHSVQRACPSADACQLLCLPSMKLQGRNWVMRPIPTNIYCRQMTKLLRVCSWFNLQLLGFRILITYLFSIHLQSEDVRYLDFIFPVRGRVPKSFPLPLLHSMQQINTTYAPWLKIYLLPRSTFILKACLFSDYH